MPRLTTRVKRRIGLTSSQKHTFRNVVKKTGARTFSTKENAEIYAKETLKLEKFTIEAAKKGKRFKVVA
jgi:hypothetical protein